MGGLNLDAQHAASNVNDEVVTVAIAPWLGDSEAEGCSLTQEGSFAKLPAPLGLSPHLLGGVLLGGRSGRLRAAFGCPNLLFVGLLHWFPICYFVILSAKKGATPFVENGACALFFMHYLNDSRLNRVNAPRLEGLFCVWYQIVTGKCSCLGF
jgi:hypothetical protein